jgi:bifunctional DNase/RNase
MDLKRKTPRGKGKGMAAEEMILIREVYLKSEPNAGNMVMLKETAEAERYVTIFVGDSEFAAIAKEKGLVDPKRPLTHELYLGILDKAGLTFQRIEITAIREDTYYADVIVSAAGVEYRVDSRPSDALALAMNRKIPIMVHRSLFRRELTQEEIKEYEGLVKHVKF